MNNYSAQIKIVVYACILLQSISTIQGAASSCKALQTKMGNPTEELEMIARKKTICPAQIIGIGRLLRAGAQPFRPSKNSTKSACSLFFENNTLWCLLGTFNEHLPNQATLPDTMVTTCGILLNENSEEILNDRPESRFLERFKMLITWGSYRKNIKKIHLNKEPLTSLMYYLCEYQDCTLKEKLITFIQTLEEEQQLILTQAEAEQSEESSETSDDYNEEEEGLQEEIRPLISPPTPPRRASMKN